MRPSSTVTAFLFLATILSAACADDTAEDAGAASRQEPSSQPTPAPAPAPTVAEERPDTTADGLWSYLRQVAYADRWEMWPGRGELYPGTDPHGMLLTTYLNDAARQALLDAGPMALPDGAIIVKENYAPDTTLVATTVMYKVGGYDPEHLDWLFAKYDPRGSAQAFGRVESCQACHRQGTGYIQTPVDR